MGRERGASDVWPVDTSREKRITPEGAVSKLERLRSMLFREAKFETRYPEAYEELFTPPFQGIGGRLAEGAGLPLPSFGVRVLRNDPRSEIQGVSYEQSADAHSTSFFHREMGEIPAPRSPFPVAEGYLRGVLLAIMAGRKTRRRWTPCAVTLALPRG